MNKLITRLLASTLLVAAIPAHAQDVKIEVLHHWVAESEAKALNVVREALAAKGFGWQDSAVGGMSGGNMQQALRSRLAAGNPPGAMQFIGWEGIDWSNQGVMRNLNELDAADNWEAAFAPQVLPFIKNGDDLIAVPINMHRQNWVWANKAAFEKAGVTQPASWADLIASADKFKAAGIIPLAMGDEPWQIQVIYDALVSDVGGPDFYKAAVVDLDEDALGSDTMKQVFDMLRQVRGLVDDGFNGRDWAIATNLVIEGKAAMQVMGDWAKGEFLAKGLKPGVDFTCFATPSATPSFQFLVDSFGMFTVKDEGVTKAQEALAEVVMDPTVQHYFNLIKGSIPARTDLGVDDFDDCAKTGFADREAAIANGAMLGASTHGFAAQPQFAAIFGDVAAQFFVTDMSSDDAVKMLVDGIANAR